MRVNTIYGDDTGYIHIAPQNTLNITGVSEYKRINVTWGPYLYRDAMMILPNGTFEIRQARSREYPSLTRSSHVTFWGRLIGDQGHLMVGFGGRVTFALSCPRFLKFVGMTIQKNGRLEYMSMADNESDKWTVEVMKGIGPVYRDGVFTIEAEGRVTARTLHVIAESLVVDPGGYLLLDGKGYPAGKLEVIGSTLYLSCGRIDVILLTVHSHLLRPLLTSTQTLMWISFEILCSIKD